MFKVIASLKYAKLIFFKRNAAPKLLTSRRLSLLYANAFEMSEHFKGVVKRCCLHLRVTYQEFSRGKQQHELWGEDTQFKHVLHFNYIWRSRVSKAPPYRSVPQCCSRVVRLSGSCACRYPHTHHC